MKAALNKAWVAISGGMLGLIIGGILGTMVALIVTAVGTKSFLGFKSIRDGIALGISFGTALGSVIGACGAVAGIIKEKNNMECKKGG